MATRELKALQSAIERAGSQSALARVCDVSQTTVWQWLHRMGRMPADYVLKAEAATGISRHDLRPDIYPVESSLRKTKVMAA